MTEVFLPINAMSLPNIEETMGYLRRLSEHGFKTGLMFLILGGEKTLTGGSKKIQHENFRKAAADRSPMPVIVMASCLPLLDLDFYHQPGRSVVHIKKAVDFADEIPGRAENPIVTFHLNTLLAPSEYSASENYEQIFDDRILPALRELATYAQTKNISLKIETTPVPEFGDLSDMSLSTLINPYPVYSKYFAKIRSAGLGIVLDTAHTAILLKEIKLPQTLMDELNQLEPTDVMHLNDSLGHMEGVALGEGEIEKLPEIIQAALKKELKIVFEINDDDYTKGSRPNLEKSINYFSQLIQPI